MATNDHDKPAAWLQSDALPRIVPFALFMAFVAVGSMLPAPVPVAPGELDTRWIYAVRALVVGAACVVLWPRFTELRSGPPLRMADWMLGVVSGIAVLAIWVHLDRGWVTFELASGFDPHRHGEESLHWPLIALRLLGLALVVPVIEELFWRSFLQRWLEKQDFLRVDPGAVGMRALLITSGLFALEHTQWLAGLIAGLAYGGVYMRTGKLWVPVIAHAVTNGGLGIYILLTHDWRFW